MARGMKFGKDGLNERFVARLAGADEIVERQVDALCELLPKDCEVVAILLRRLAFALSRLLDFLAMLIQAGQKEHFGAEAALGTSDDVGQDFLVSMAEVR